MSAFIVDPTHIDLILSTAINGPRDWAPRPGSWFGPYVNELLPGTSGALRREDADRAGRALLTECIASVSFRYPDDAHELPGPIPTPDPPQYEWTDFGRRLTAIEACKATACYEYQSCEHPGWDGSGAAKFCERLRSSLIGTMAGYEEAPWSWTTELALERGAPRPRAR